MRRYYVYVAGSDNGEYIPAKSRRDAIRRIARQFGSLGMIAGIHWYPPSGITQVAQVRGTSGKTLTIGSHKEG